MKAPLREPFYVELGSRLRRCREHRELPLTDVIMRLNGALTYPSLINIEGGRQRIRVHTLLQLVTIYELDWDSLLDDMPAWALKRLRKK